MSVPDISVEVAKKVTAIGQEMKSRATRGSRALKNAELQVLRGQRGGRSYKKSFKKSSYTASAPGEPPAVRSGKLRSSFRPVAGSSGGAWPLRQTLIMQGTWNMAQAKWRQGHTWKRLSRKRNPKSKAFSEHRTTCKEVPAWH